MNLYRDVLLSLCIILPTSGYENNNAGLTELPSDIPTDSPVIAIYGNNIETVPDDAFEGFTALRDFNMNSNLLTSMPYLVPTITTIRVIKLKGNR